MAVSTINTPGKVAGLESIASFLNSSFSYLSGGIAKYGHMVFVNIRVQTNEQIPSGTLNIFSAGAFPPPMLDSNNQTTAVILTAYEGNIPNALNPFIPADGSLKFGVNFPGLSATQGLWLTGVYLTNE